MQSKVAYTVRVINIHATHWRKPADQDSADADPAGVDPGSDFDLGGDFRSPIDSFKISCRSFCITTRSRPPGLNQQA
jgi:hypothetical protein